MCIDINNQKADFNLANNLSLGYVMFLLHIKKQKKQQKKQQKQPSHFVSIVLISAA